MQWLELAAVTLAAVLMLAVIGVPLAYAVGLRGYWIIGAAPAFAVTVIGGAAIVAPWIGLSWSLLPVVIVAVALGGALLAVRRATRRFESAPPGRRPFNRWLLLAILTAAVLLAVRFVLIIGEPSHISQTFDNVFHLNGVRFILDTGNASSLWIGRMTGPEGSLAFYPAGWHALVSLVVQVSGSSIPVAINAVTLATAAVIWPVGALLLTRVLFGRSPVLTVSAGIAAAGIPLFPMLLMDYGVLYPYQLGVALLPIALALTMRALRLGPETGSPNWWWWAVAVAGALAGIVLAHPGAFMAWLALSAPMVVVFVIVRWRSASAIGPRVAIVAGVLGYLSVGVALRKVLRPPLEARQWPPQMSLWDASVDVLTVSAWYQVAAAAVAIAVVAGLVWACVSRRTGPVVAIGLYVVTAVLFINVAANPLPQLRDLFTAPWYNNVPRLAALLPIALVPLAAYGVDHTWSRITGSHAWKSTSARWPRWATAGLAAVLIAVAIAVTQIGPGTPWPAAQRSASAAYEFTPDSPLLSPDEAELISRIPSHVPEGVAIAGSPWTGSSLAYALADRRVLMPHLLMDVSDELDIINDGLNEADSEAEVCDALADLDVGFVLDFGGPEVHGGDHVFPGFVGLETSDSVSLVDEQGEARLYEIVACDA